MQGDEGAGRLAPFFVGHGGDRRFEDGRVAVECFFDFNGRNIFTPGDDDVPKCTDSKLSLPVGIVKSLYKLSIKNGAIGDPNLATVNKHVYKV